MHFHPFFLPVTSKKKCILTLPLKRTLWYWLLLVFPQYHQVPDEYFTSAVVLSLILAALFGLVYLLIIPQCVQQILFPWHSLSSFKWLSITLMLSSIALTRLSFHSGAQPYSSSSSSASASCWLVSCTCMSHGSRYDCSSILLFRSLSVRYLNVQAHFLSQLWSQTVELQPLQTIIVCNAVCGAVFRQCLAHLSFYPSVFPWLPNHSDPHRSLHSHSALNLRCGPGLCGK